MNEIKPNNPNDYKIVEVSNTTDFDFTSELGCMFDGNPMELKAGETRQYPYHIGRRLSLNLAKQVFLKGASKDTPEEKKTGHGRPLWASDSLADKDNEFMKELYTEEKPLQVSEHDALMQKVLELEKFKTSFESRELNKEEKSTSVHTTKADVIKVLEKQGVQFDAKKTKAELELLLEEE